MHELPNPQQHTKRLIPSQDEKINLIVPLEKHTTDGMQFDYTELLVDNITDLIVEVQGFTGVACAAAVGEDLDA